MLIAFLTLAWRFTVFSFFQFQFFCVHHTDHTAPQRYTLAMSGNKTKITPKDGTQDATSDETEKERLQKIAQIKNWDLAAEGKNIRENSRKEAHTAYAKSLKERKGIKACCTGPKDWKEAYQIGLAECAGPISRLDYRIEFGSKIITFFALLGLGFSFLINWVVVKNLRFTNGQPFP
jgi:hypothetical protein